MPVLIHSEKRCPIGVFNRCAVLALVALCLSAHFSTTLGQELTPQMLDEVARRTGLSREEVEAQYREAGNAGRDTSGTPTPGRTSLSEIDDRPLSKMWRDTDTKIVLPFSLPDTLSAGLLPDSLAFSLVDTSTPFFGNGFFELEAGLFEPPSFGPVPEDYRLGVGDEIVVNVWGQIEFQLVRIVDRDGSIILPRAGKIQCSGRTLAELDEAVRSRLVSSHASLGREKGEDQTQAGTHLEITLGRLRAIRVFVVGEAERPGSYELNSVSTVLTALYAAGGPSDLGSYREIRLMRGDDTVGELDLYAYFVEGKRGTDTLLREGDTVFVPARGRGVRLVGAVRRPIWFEMLRGEGVGNLINFAGGFAPQAASETIHIQRILPPGQRAVGLPDKVFLDVPFNAEAMRPANGDIFELMDGDLVIVDVIEDRMDNFVEIQGEVKRPGRYQLLPGMTAVELLGTAGGLWPDALTERAVIDRTSMEGTLFSVAVPLSEILDGREGDVELEARDVLHIFSRWDIQTRPEVHISGEVFRPHSEEFRQGMTLRDMVLKSGGLRKSADLLQAEVSRLRVSAIASRDITQRPEQTVEIIPVPLGEDFLSRKESFLLHPYDRIAVRRLPWWELQRTVTVRGEVFYPGVFSLERKDETLSSIIARAGGLSPDAYLIGARVIRQQDDVGNIAVDLLKAMEEPGSQYDIILQEGDEIVVPDRMFTVKVVGEVGFPTSLVFEEGRDINYFVDRAGGYLEKADKKKARVVYPNGLSLPNKGGSKVVAGSTIIVPVKPPPEGPGSLATMREIAGIFAGLATVWLVIYTTTR